TLGAAAGELFPGDSTRAGPDPVAAGTGAPRIQHSPAVHGTRRRPPPPSPARRLNNRPAGTCSRSQQGPDELAGTPWYWLAAVGPVGLPDDRKTRAHTANCIN